MKFPKRALKGLADFQWYEGEGLDLDAIEEPPTDVIRGVVWYRLVFRDNNTGKHYMIHYCREGEEQDGEPFKYEPDEVEVDEVRPVERVVIQYEEVWSDDPLEEAKPLRNTIDFQKALQDVNLNLIKVLAEEPHPMSAWW